MDKVSIIIPVYNVESYIEKCLDSILQQEYDNKEIIVINDGSTDKSEEVISKYFEKIKYVKKENSGLSDTRNLGIDMATGKYIMFVDADDYIELDLLKKLRPYIEQDIDLNGFYAWLLDGEQELELIGDNKKINAILDNQIDFKCYYNSEF